MVCQSHVTTWHLGFVIPEWQSGVSFILLFEELSFRAPDFDSMQVYELRGTTWKTGVKMLSCIYL